MNIEKQKLLVEYLVASHDTFALCSPIVLPNYFDPELRNAVTFVKNYYDEYNTIPDVMQVEAETGTKLEPQIITKDKIEYCANEIETFCKRKAIEGAILNSPDLIEKGDYGKVEELIKTAITVSLNRDLGLQYFENPEERMREMLEGERPHPTGWKEFDDALNGGIVRKQMTLFSANSGGGKSIVMANLALNMMEQGLSVLYISLELSQNMVSQRFDSMVTGITQAEWKQRVTETATKLESVKGEMGELFIKYMPAGSNSNDFRAYLKEFELQFGMVPDMLVVDYLDIMGTNSKISADNVFEKDKLASEELRNIGAEYNMFVVTASQQNRGAVGQTDLNHSHIAGGLSKINTTDVYVSIIMTDAMRTAGEIAMQFLKTRSSDGVGKTIYLAWNGKTLRVTDPSGQGPNNGGVSFTNEKSNNDDFLSEGDGSGLLDLIKSTS